MSVVGRERGDYYVSREEHAKDAQRVGGCCELLLEYITDNCWSNRKRDTFEIKCKSEKLNMFFKR